MSLSSAHPAHPVRVAHATWADRLFRAVIVGVGVICLALLAWGHLGLGAWIMPPAPSAPEQQAVAGAYHVLLRADSGQLTAHGPNTVSFVVSDASGHPVTNATVLVAPAMTSMAMAAPSVSAAGSAGRYSAHPLFGMAGQWRLNVSIAVPGAPVRHATFAVSVRWS